MAWYQQKKNGLECQKRFYFVTGCIGGMLLSCSQHFKWVVIMKDYKPKKIERAKSAQMHAEIALVKVIPCQVCISHGAPCAAMTQQLFSGKAQDVECELMKHSF